MTTIVELYELFEHAKDLDMRIYWLLDTFELWDKDGCFTFPDGNIWRKEDYDNRV